MQALSIGLSHFRSLWLSLAIFVLLARIHNSSGWILGWNTRVSSSSVHPLDSTANSHKDSSDIVGWKEGLIRYRGRVAYDGSNFRGFQIQQGKNARTIQGTLEEVLQRRFNRSSLRVVGAGRTDTGVNARGQSFHFDLTTEEHKKLQEIKNNRTQPPLDYTMNRMLTDEIRVWNVGPAPPLKEKPRKINDSDRTATTRLFNWNAIHGSTHKLYTYRICLEYTAMDPIYRFQRWQVPRDTRSKPLDIVLLEKTLKRYEGTHDFRAFAGAVEQAEKRAQRKVNSVRTIYECRLIDESEDYGRRGYYRIEIMLSGALYKMVRNMVGTAIDVARGVMDETEFLELLQNSGEEKPQLTRKNNRSKPAPPQGLTLEWVFYEGNDGF